MSNSTREIDILDSATQDIVFLPSPEQRKTKATFLAALQDNPIFESPEDVTLAMAENMTGDSRLRRWWTIPGFREWFSNGEEFRQRLEYLSNLVLDTYEDVLLDPKAPPSAKIQAGKIILEAAKKMPGKQAEIVYADERISQMDKKQLEEYIRKSAKLLSPEDK